MLKAKKIGIDIENIYKREMKKTKWYNKKKIKKIKAIKTIRKEINNYYCRSIDSDELLKRIVKLNFITNYSYQLSTSIIFGIVTGLCASIIIKTKEQTDIVELMELGNDLGQGEYGKIIYMCWCGIVFIVLACFILLPVILLIFYGYFLSKTILTNNIQILIYKYEKSLIIKKLKYEHDFQFEAES